MTTPAAIPQSRRRLRQLPSAARLSAYGIAALAVASWLYIILGTDSGFPDLVDPRTWQNTSRFLQGLLGLNATRTPAYFQVDRWLVTGKLAYNTLMMSVLAIGIAGIGTLLTVLLAARNVSNGELGGAPSRLGTALYLVMRVIYALARAVPELVWALIIVFLLSPGVLPGAVALGLHNFGIVGKLSAEVVENLDPGPARALRSAGAGNFQMLLYGVIPQALPQFLTYLLYRWEVIIRTTIVVGFVSAGGLGQEFRLRMSFFHYTDVALIILWYLILVALVDLLSAGLRRLARR